MPSSSETGHAKNVANFENLVAFVAGYGTQYNPSRDALKLPVLQTQLAEARTALSNCKTKETAFDNATDTRRDAFAGIKALGTRLVNALKVSGVPDNVVEGAKTINRKLQGQRASAVEITTPATVPGASQPPQPVSISASQQSYDNIAEHFNGLIELLSSQPQYNPNETDLKITALQQVHQNLKAATTTIYAAETEWSNSRIYRNSILYAKNTGIVDIAADVKAYIKSVFGATSPQYAQVKGLEIKTIRS